MHIKQYTVEDWLDEFRRNPKALSQVAIVASRTGGRSLATWEQNCLKAAQQLKVAA